MGKIVFDLVLGIILLFGIGYFLAWRLFFKFGKAVDKEVNKIKAEIKKEEKN